MLDQLIALVDKVYYVADEWCPKHDEEGKPVTFWVQLPLSEEKLCVVHPDNLVQVQEAAASVNVRLLEYPRYEMI